MMCFSKGAIGCCGYNIRRYNADGTTAWMKRFDGNPVSLDPWKTIPVGVGASGSAGDALHCCGRSDNSVAVVGRRNDRNYDLRVFSAGGDVVWERDVRADAYPSISESFEYFAAVAVGCTVDRVGVLWVVSRDGFGPVHGYAVYDADGELISTTTIGSLLSGTVVRCRGVVDSDGIFYGCWRRGVTAGAIVFGIGGTSPTVGIDFNPGFIVTDAEDLALDVDADEVGAAWRMGTKYLSRIDTSVVWSRTDRITHASRLQGGDVIGAGPSTGTASQPLQVYDWATGNTGATWPTNGPTSVNWDALRVRHMRPNDGAIACLSALSAPVRCNVMRIDGSGEILWRHKHTSSGFADFSPSPDGSVTGVTQIGGLEQTGGDVEFVDPAAT